MVGEGLVDDEQSARLSSSIGRRRRWGTRRRGCCRRGRCSSTYSWRAVGGEGDAEQAPLAVGRRLVGEVEHGGRSSAGGRGDAFVQDDAPDRLADVAARARRRRGRRCTIGGGRPVRTRRRSASADARPRRRSRAWPGAADRGGRRHGVRLGRRRRSAARVSLGHGPRRSPRRSAGGHAAAASGRGDRPDARRDHRATGRIRPSWTTVTARSPSWVKIEPRAMPRPPDGGRGVLA